EKFLLEQGIDKKELTALRERASQEVENDFQNAIHSADPEPDDFNSHEFAPTFATEEKGNRSPKKAEKIAMVDAALHAVDEILSSTPEAMFYGQDVGRRLGGVFREA